MRQTLQIPVMEAQMMKGLMMKRGRVPTLGLSEPLVIRPMKRSNSMKRRDIRRIGVGVEPVWLALAEGTGICDNDRNKSVLFPR